MAIQLTNCDEFTVLSSSDDLDRPSKDLLFKNVPSKCSALRNVDSKSLLADTWTLDSNGDWGTEENNSNSCRRLMLSRIVITVVVSIIVIVVIALVVSLTRTNSNPELPRSEILLPRSAERILFVPTECGNVTGSVNAKYNVSVFRAIQYALPPLDELRWSDAIPLTASLCRNNNITVSQKAVGRCLQSNIYISQQQINDRVVGAEDCLYLDVYSPDFRPSNVSKKPVVVFLHGGWLMMSSGSDKYWTPTAQASRDLDTVIITLNYRLSVFGWLPVPQKKEGEFSANRGLTDVIAALKWVSSNIENFGGDSSKVTLLGHAAGGLLISALLQSSAGNGLFQNAWIMSGGTHFPVDVSSSYEKYGSDVVRRIGCRSANISETYHCLRTADATRLIHLAPLFSPPYWAMRPLWDIPGSNITEEQNTTPLIIAKIGILDQQVNPDVALVLSNTFQENAFWPTISDFSKEFLTNHLRSALENVQAGDLVPSDMESLSAEDIKKMYFEITTNARIACPLNSVAEKWKSKVLYRLVTQTEPNEPIVTTLRSNYRSKESFQGWDLLALLRSYRGVDTSVNFTPTLQEYNLGEVLRNALKEFAYNGAIRSWSVWQDLQKLNVISTNGTLEKESKNSYTKHMNCDVWKDSFSWKS